MFGYVTINKEALSKEEYQRFRAHYCGLCRTLGERYGKVGRTALSYDMTFMGMLLTSLYEPAEETGEQRCAARPARPHAYVVSEASRYAADMNIALAYHVCRDHMEDDNSTSARAKVKLLKKPYAQVKALYPDKCALIEECVANIREIEKDKNAPLDAPSNETGRLLGAIYAWKDDLWAPTLYDMGSALGRFIYVMDAYDDLADDLKRNRFNPLISLREKQDFEEMCQKILTMHIAECAQEFEKLPIINDANILKCVLYSGVWTRYAYLQKRKEEKK